MLKDFKPKYMEKPQPLEGFTCTATGGAYVEVRGTIFGDKPARVVSLHTTSVDLVDSTWTKEDLIEFASKLLEVAKNM